MPTLAHSLGRHDLPRISPRKIPHAKFKTWNPCSLSLHRTDPEGRLRKVRVLACMTRLLAGCDILCIQEGRLGALDNSSLNHYFPNHLIYYENDLFGHGGAITLVSRRFARDYTIEQIKKDGAAYGRILSLVFTPITLPSLLPTKTLCVTNVYLTSSADPDTRVREFLVLAQLDPTHRHIVCGDFNFVETAEDAPSQEKRAQSMCTASPTTTTPAWSGNSSTTSFCWTPRGHSTLSRTHSSTEYCWRSELAWHSPPQL
jgi:exonuclease III